MLIVSSEALLSTPAQSPGIVPNILLVPRGETAASTDEQDSADDGLLDGRDVSDAERLVAILTYYISTGPEGADTRACMRVLKGPYTKKLDHRSYDSLVKNSPGY